MLGPVQQLGVDEPLEAQQMVFPRQDLQKQAAGAQHPGKFLRHGQGEETEDGVKTAAREGQMGRAGGDPVPGAIADGGVAHRVLGDIDAPELGVQRLGQGRAVIALAGIRRPAGWGGAAGGAAAGPGPCPGWGRKTQRPKTACGLQPGPGYLPGAGRAFAAPAGG